MDFFFPGRLTSRISIIKGRQRAGFIKLSLRHIIADSRGFKNIKTYIARKYKLQAYKISHVAAYYSHARIVRRACLDSFVNYISFTQSHGILHEERYESRKSKSYIVLRDANRSLLARSMFAGWFSSTIYSGIHWAGYTIETAWLRPLTQLAWNHVVAKDYVQTS